MERGSVFAVAIGLLLGTAIWWFLFAGEPIGSPMTSPAAPVGYAHGGDFRDIKTFWDQKAIRVPNTCYSYAINRPHMKTTCLIPGLVGQCRNIPFEAEFTCSGLVEGAKRDGLLLASREKRCPTGYHKVFLATNEGIAFHWYRQEPDGFWTHKWGRRWPVEEVDGEGNLIHDPELAVRTHPGDKERMEYPNACAYMCARD
jgi:hypothetical protein